MTTIFKMLIYIRTGLPFLFSTSLSWTSQILHFLKKRLKEPHNTAFIYFYQIIIELVSIISLSFYSFNLFNFRIFPHLFLHG